jgi:hypothetical protein
MVERQPSEHRQPSTESRNDTNKFCAVFVSSQSAMRDRNFEGLFQGEADLYSNSTNGNPTEYVKYATLFHQKLKIKMLAGPKVIDMHKRTSHTSMLWSRYFRGNFVVSCFWIFGIITHCRRRFVFHIVIAVLGSEKKVVACRSRFGKSAHGHQTQKVRP